jgi:hypothetical protein
MATNSMRRLASLMRERGIFRKPGARLLIARRCRMR